MDVFWNCTFSLLTFIFPPNKGKNVSVLVMFTRPQTLNDLFMGRNLVVDWTIKQLLKLVCIQIYYFFLLTRYQSFTFT